MALIKFGGLITEARGSMAGNVYSRNRYGAYIRARTKPINPNTARQVATRAALAFLTDRWSQTLTAGQRTAWNLYGANVVMTNKLGESINLSGFNHYLRSNVIRKRVSQTIVDDGPVIFEIPEADPTFTITASEATQQVTVTFDNTLPWSTEANGMMHTFHGQPQNAQRNFFGGPWKGVVNIVGIDPGGAVSPDVATFFYAIAELQHIWCYARISRMDGRLSAPFRDDVFVGA